MLGTFIASIQNEETLKPSNFSGIKISRFVDLLLFIYFSNPKLRSRTWVILLKSAIVRGIILSTNNPCKFVDTTGSYTILPSKRQQQSVRSGVIKCSNSKMWGIKLNVDALQIEKILNSYF